MLLLNTFILALDLLDLFIHQKLVVGPNFILGSRLVSRRERASDLFNFTRSTFIRFLDLDLMPADLCLLLHYLSQIFLNLTFFDFLD